MFLNEEFLNIYEKLSELNESKADIQRLIDFAGEDLANRFLAVKNKLKAPENDLYYWIKNKTPHDLWQTLINIEAAQSDKQHNKEQVRKGAQLVGETVHWKVYHITSYEAASVYGRDTKWCITGINGWGDFYWKDYKGKGADFYFLITTENYDPRALDSKFAIAVYPEDKTYEAFNQKDGQVLIEDIKYIDEVKISGVDLWALESRGPRCSVCNDFVFNEEGEEDSLGNLYCPTCWNSELREWVDKNGNKINTNTTTSASTAASGSYKKRFEKLIKYHIDHASSELESITTKDIKPYGFHLGEHYNTGHEEFDRDIVASAEKNTGTLTFGVFVNGKEVCRRQCKDYEEFVKELGDSYMYLADIGTQEYDDLLVEWVDSKGNKVNINNSSAQPINQANTSTKSNKERFEELTNYMRNNRGTMSILSEIVRVHDAGFTYREHWDAKVSAIGDPYVLTLLVGYSRFNSSWSYELYMDSAKIKEMKGSGMDDLITELGQYFRTPKPGSKEYDSITK